MKPNLVLLENRNYFNLHLFKTFNRPPLNKTDNKRYKNVADAIYLSRIISASYGD